MIKNFIRLKASLYKESQPKPLLRDSDVDFTPHPSIAGALWLSDLKFFLRLLPFLIACAGYMLSQFL